MSTIARVFVSQAEAEAARIALVEAGISTNDIEVTFQGDEAGPVRGNFLTGDSKQSIGMQEEYDARFKKMGEASRFILTVRVEEIDRGDAEAALGRIGGQTIDSVSAATPPVSDD